MRDLLIGFLFVIICILGISHSFTVMKVKQLEKGTLTHEEALGLAEIDAEKILKMEELLQDMIQAIKVNDQVNGMQNQVIKSMRERQNAY